MEPQQSPSEPPNADDITIRAVRLDDCEQIAALVNIEMPWFVQSVSRGSSKAQPKIAEEPATIANAAHTPATSAGYFQSIARDVGISGLPAYGSRFHPEFALIITQ